MANCFTSRTGEVASGLRIANHIASKRVFLAWDFHREALFGLPVKIVGLPADHFVDHGAVSDLRRYLRIDSEGINEQVREAIAELSIAPATPATPASPSSPIEARSA